MSSYCQKIAALIKKKLWFRKNFDENFMISGGEGWSVSVEIQKVLMFFQNISALVWAAYTAGKTFQTKQDAPLARFCLIESWWVVLFTQYAVHYITFTAQYYISLTSFEVWASLSQPIYSKSVCFMIVGALVTWAIYTQGQLLLWSSLIITGIVPGYK